MAKIISPKLDYSHDKIFDEKSDMPQPIKKKLTNSEQSKMENSEKRKITETSIIFFTILHFSVFISIVDMGLKLKIVPDS